MRLPCTVAQSSATLTLGQLLPTIDSASPDMHRGSPPGQLITFVFGCQAQSSLPVMVYFHGGCWFLNSMDTHDGIMRRFANAGSLLVIGVEYRFVPTPSPWQCGMTDFALSAVELRHVYQAGTRAQISSRTGRLLCSHTGETQRKVMYPYPASSPYHHDNLPAELFWPQHQCTGCLALGLWAFSADGSLCLQWAARNASRFLGDPDRLVVAGDSCGGNLAAAVCMLAIVRPDIGVLLP